MKKIFLGFIAIGLLTFVGCKKDEGNSSSGIQYGAGATDIDGNTYQSVIIGNQEWMVENLRTSKYSDGTSIPNVTDDTQWNSLITGGWCHYDNDNQYDTIYGKLYNWYAVETSKLCPTGWHVPTDSEWTVLTDYLSANGHNGVEGIALKAKSGWEYKGEPYGNGTDDYGWLGVPGGYRFYAGYFNAIGSSGSWWSSSQFNFPYYAWNRGLSFSSGYVFRDDDNKANGFSVRCLRD